ncbi:ATP synthase mitochondrial F1 complex assembly factor 1-like [Dendronephthya gigantea]|uniref:ATP synthase mitochondrial F1 complex assembly factor 1-like n=1 Tax=Dendronephthya gigantea TaxID=151771 RepID=UPI00106B57D4|nr:ATP synthase mitochondrial F1 complex assembly factor 1-like [Dendronephthya gigantea]
MAVRRGVGIYFRQFLLQGRNKRINTTSFIAACYSTEKDEITSNPFFDKYAEKIKRATSSQSVENQKTKATSSTFYENVLNREIEDFKAKSQKKSSISPNSRDGSRSLYGQKGLDAIMHLEKVKDESAGTIEELWREHHRNKDCVSAVIPAEMYDKIQEKAREYPMFVYPVPRNEGYELMVGEFSDDQFYLTSVINYQTLGENSPWLVAFTHFTELKESKGIVLMVGEVDTKQLATHEAMFIANLIQLYYGTDDGQKLSLLRTFNKNPDQFNHMSVIEEMQRSTVQSPGDE